MSRKGVLVSVDVVKRIDNRLSEIAQRHSMVNARAAITVLHDRIRQLMREGVPIARVAEIIREEGLPISEHTLRAYLSRCRRHPHAHFEDDKSEGSSGLRS